MNYNILFTLFLSSVMSVSSLAQSTNEVPFSKGVNLTEWFQAGSASQIDFSKFTFEDVKDIKSLGVDVIRLPINLHAMTKGAPNYELEPLFLFFLDEVVDWAEELEIYLILDNHTFDPGTATDPNIGDILNPVWENMAKHYKDRSKYVLYEILNEPHGISNSTWSSIQGEVISTIRAVDTTHTIIVGASDYNSFRSLKFLPEYANIEKPIFAKLNQNFPNPFNPTTTISFELSEASTTTLTVYDTLGRIVTELVNTTLSEGSYSYNFEAPGLSSGIYFYKLNTNTGTQVKKMLLLK